MYLAGKVELTMFSLYKALKNPTLLPSQVLYRHTEITIPLLFSIETNVTGLRSYTNTFFDREQDAAVMFLQQKRYLASLKC